MIISMFAQTSVMTTYVVMVSLSLPIPKQMLLFCSLLTNNCFLTLQCRLFALQPLAFVNVHCSDPAGHQDSARRAEMGRQSFRGRGEWELFSFFFLQIHCLQPHTLHSHSHTLGLETVNNHPTDFLKCTVVHQA